VSAGRAFDGIAPHIVESFEKFHAENPHVYGLFKAFCEDARKAGRGRYGAKAVLERIRWHVEVEARGDAFKVNNNFTSCYSRLLIAEDPSFSSFFSLRGGSNG
jgi:hypothetical protein